MFQHYLITRFNLKVAGWEKTRTGEQVRDEAWLKNRIHLFKNYCLPSVLNQSRKDFLWLIFFNIDTPEHIQNEMMDLCGGHAFIRILYIDGLDALQPSVKHFIEKDKLADTKYIITSRLDNDDILHKDFIYTIYKMALIQKKVVIDTRKGFQIVLNGDDVTIRDYNTSFNPFISLLEKADCIETVFSRMHAAWDTGCEVLVYDKEPLWIELVHSKNKLNGEKGNLPKALKFKANDFALPASSFFVKKDLDFFKRKLKKILFKSRGSAS